MKEIRTSLHARVAPHVRKEERTNVVIAGLCAPPILLIRQRASSSIPPSCVSLVVVLIACCLLSPPRRSFSATGHIDTQQQPPPSSLVVVVVAARPALILRSRTLFCGQPGPEKEGPFLFAPAQTCPHFPFPLLIPWNRFVYFSISSTFPPFPSSLFLFLLSVSTLYIHIYNSQARLANTRISPVNTRTQHLPPTPPLNKQSPWIALRRSVQFPPLPSSTR